MSMTTIPVIGLDRCAKPALDTLQDAKRYARLIGGNRISIHSFRCWLERESVLELQDEFDWLIRQKLLEHESDSVYYRITSKGWAVEEEMAENDSED